MPSDAEVVEVLARALDPGPWSGVAEDFARTAEPEDAETILAQMRENQDAAKADAAKALAALRSAGYAVVKADMQRDARRMAMALLDWTPDLNVQTEAEARATEEEILAIARRFALTKDPTNAQ